MYWSKLTFLVNLRPPNREFINVKSVPDLNDYKFIYYAIQVFAIVLWLNVSLSSFKWFISNYTRVLALISFNAGQRLLPSFLL